MPAMIHHPGLPPPPDVITYRMNSKLVLVRPADDFEQALDYAQKEFSEELQGVPRECVEFYANSRIDGQRQVVRISEFAWIPTVARFLRGEVVDIVIKQLHRKENAPPNYLDVPKFDSPVSAPSSPKRASSPLPTRRSRSWFGRR